MFADMDITSLPLLVAHMQVMKTGNNYPS